MPAWRACSGLVRTKRHAVEFDRAGVGAARAAQDIHQRALAGAVFADQRVRFAGRHRKESRRAAPRFAERFAYASHRESRRTHTASRYSASGGCSSGRTDSLCMFSVVTNTTPVSMRDSTVARRGSS